MLIAGLASLMIVSGNEAELFGIFEPGPIKRIPFELGNVTVAVQVTVPVPVTLTVSPSAAPAMAAFTAAAEQSAGPTVMTAAGASKGWKLTRNERREPTTKRLAENVLLIPVLNDRNAVFFMVFELSAAST